MPRLRQHSVRTVWHSIRGGLCGIALLLWLSVNPVAAQNWGGIELGGEGIKLVIGNFEKGEFRAKNLEKAATRNIGLSGAVVDKKTFQEGAIAEAVGIVKEFLNELKNQQVPPENIRIVVSSGLAGAAGDALKSLQQEILEKTAINVDVIQGKDEAQFTFLGVAPSDPVERDGSLLVDVGGGNTKLATAMADPGTVPFGARTLADARKKDSVQSADDQARKNTAETLGAIFKKREETKPNEEAIKTVFLTGGTAYITATFLRAQQVGQNPTGKLTLPIAEIKAFSESLQNAASIADVFDARLPKGAPDDAVVANYIRAKGIYDLDRLRAGAWMLSSTLEYVQLKYPNVKEVVYDGNGLFAWMKGYLQNAKKKADGPTTSDEVLGVSRTV